MPSSLRSIYDAEVASNKKRRVENWPQGTVKVRVYDSAKHGTRLVNPTLPKPGTKHSGVVLTRRQYREQLLAARRKARRTGKHTWVAKGRAS